MYAIDGTSITLTRGDSFSATVIIYDAEGEEYTPEETDVIRFKCKKGFSDAFRTLIEKTIPNDTLELVLEPEDTEHLSYGDYVYDIQLTTGEGVIDTFISSTLTLTGETDTHE